ncbi:hypothetical protein J2Z40_001523 [Cytobacillus eiseniae]|uniref:Uncharacterized protein n=1 Tax=Cytobacillus eiseniae TaxID=762947 RepID=A0ABS4RDI6_9BACI|nr:hypothetical protein [Cytobacillus eiseniae]MBP2240963.1 hypothetical protein [Cytobacillus eiseniae]
MIKDWLFPWESHIMINHPLAMPVFMGIASFFLSIVTWTRGNNNQNKSKQKDMDEN